MIKPRISLDLSGDNTPQIPPKPLTPITASTPSNKSKQALTNVREEGTEGGMLTSLLPSVPKPAWPIWALDYLKAMLDTRTDGAAANAVGITYRSVYEQRLRHKDFDAAVLKVRRYRDSLIVDSLEEVGLRRALEGGTDDRMSASLNMFHLKARDHRYKDQAPGQGPGVINITFGAAIGGQQGQSMTVDLATGQEVKEADYEDVKR